MSSPDRYTTVSDERSGHWTKVTFHDDRVVFSASRPKPHWLAFVIGIPILLLTLASAVKAPLLAAVFCLIIVWLIISTRRFRQAELPLVLSKGAIQDGGARVYHAEQIRGFVIRENKDRQTDDDQLLQIYLDLKDEEQLVLLHQNHNETQRNESTRATFDQLQQWYENATQ